MVRYLFYTIGDLTYQSPLVQFSLSRCRNFFLPQYSLDENETKFDALCSEQLAQLQVTYEEINFDQAILFTHNAKYFQHCHFCNCTLP